jgi:hypothetical protein
VGKFFLFLIAMDPSSSPSSTDEGIWPTFMAIAGSSSIDGMLDMVSSRKPTTHLQMSQKFFSLVSKGFAP